ncbi:trypsin-like serine protease (plasmid) [Photobacterium sp. GJ3]|uniref:trypsin-like serine protease n=1 Tax=Photobacterium sp. GJ3 TaxID=2829502 RepID=UPI001B8C9936|nr:trypsin-like serine protease [Photobacterium sp. GJ3]QUJ70287.1 trypsin-like serine protease [Photobacterium sp. GJ3]
MKQRIFPLATLAAVFASLPVQAETGVNEIDVNYSPRIVGGTDAVAQDWQFFTQIVSRNGNRPFCGASYLGEGYVLTAAHCVDNDRPSDIAVKIGAHQFNGTDGIRAEISQIHIHPQYRRATLTNDIAVLKLTSNVIAPTVEIAAGSLSQYVSVGDKLRVAGVGRLFENGTSPTILQEVTVPLVSDAVCQQGGGSYQNVGLDNFCAGYAQGQKDSCQGDSGGPIIVKRNGQITQLGIVSWGIGCARPNQYGVYSDIAALRDWVDTVISGTDTPVALSYEKQVVLPDFHVGELRQHEFKFTNTGVAPISINEAIAKSTGVTDAAVVASDTCSVATLTQNQSCAVRVEFGARIAGQAGVTVTLFADQIQGPVEAHVTAAALDQNGGGQYDFIYPNGLGQYRPGTIVLATDGQRYQCRPYPSSQWCNFGGAYAPGAGWASKDAWLTL